MPSHFSTVGFPIESDQDFIDLSERLLDQLDNLHVDDVSDGQYLSWRSPCGAAVWLQVNAEHELIGMVPHFAGESRFRAGITTRILRPEATELDGAFHAWAEPSEEDPESGTYPFLFDVPDFQTLEELPIPSIVTVQLAAFAHEIEIFESEEAFNASQTDELKFASQSFIPSGLFSQDGESNESPPAFGIFTGHIQKAEQKTNPLSGESYYWALVDSLGGHFDVVIDPELVDNEPRAGAFWLTGLIAND